MIFYNIVVSALSIPFGRLSDKIGRKKLLVAGYFVFALCYLVFGFAGTKAHMIIAFALYGGYTGMIAGVERAFIAEASPPPVKGTMRPIHIRPEAPEDYRAVEELTLAAFKNFEAEGVPKRDIPNEHFLVRLLRDDPAFVPALDLVAEEGGEIVGHIMYSQCAIIRPGGAAAEALTFGPVSVSPARQGRGIGRAFIE